MPNKLSIITICYNEKDVENTCLSIVNQTWQGFEWIVIDGGSEPWCADILEKYRSHMAFYVSEKDNGVYDAMNKGISTARGEYLLFMNAGDLLYDNTVLCDIFAKNDYSADIIYGNEKLMRRDGTYKVLGGQINFDKKAFWLVYYSLRHQATFIKKSLFDTYGTYDTNYTSAADFERFLHFIYLKKCSVQFVDRFISIFKLFDGISSDTGKTGKQELAAINRLVFGNIKWFWACIARFISHLIAAPVFNKTKRHAVRRAVVDFLVDAHVDTRANARVL